MKHELKTMNGALIQSPVPFEEGRKNWAAVLDQNEEAQGGWDRKFLDKARGDDVFTWLLGSWCRVGTTVEFAADFYVNGEKNHCRSNCVVEHVGEDSIILSEWPSKLEAFEHGLQVFQNQPGPYMLKNVPAEYLIAALNERGEGPQQGAGLEMEMAKSTTPTSDDDIPF